MDGGFWVAAIVTGLILLSLVVLIVRESAGSIGDRRGPRDESGHESSGGGGGG